MEELPVEGDWEECAAGEFLVQQDIELGYLGSTTSTELAPRSQVP